jgi:hypothetical protein
LKQYRGKLPLGALAAVVPLGALAGVVLEGCGATSSPTTTYHPLTPATGHPAKSERPAPRIGATQRVSAGGTTLSVTISRLLDPLTGSGASLLPNTRAVGVVAAVRNHGPGAYDSSSTGDFSVVPSSGAATPAFSPRGACQTPLRDWDNEISPGEVRSGCVTFAVPTRASVKQVRFSPHARATGRVIWLVAH